MAQSQMAIQQGMTWKRESDLVVLELARSKSGEDELVIINENWNDGGTSEVDVDENRPAFVYGALHAKRDSAGIVHVTVEPKANVDHQDFSFQFEHYVCIGGSPSNPEKPSKFVLFESKEFPNYFITWDLNVDMTDGGEAAEDMVKCEHLSKTSDGLPDIKISPNGEIVKPDDSEIQRFVWVIPVDERNVPQFALKAYGRSYFMVFKQTTGKTLLVPSGEVNSEVTIFRLRSI